MDQERLLVDKILNGDLQAFQQFVEKYQRLVTHMVFRMILNESDREELCQDVFLKVYQNLSKFQFQSKLSTWISRITYNTCINYLQKKKAILYDDLTIRENDSDSSSLDGGASNLDSLKGELPQPDESTISQETTELLYAELNNLPAQYRTIITLYHLDNLSYEEIGEITGMPMGTVKNYLFRARKLLKDKLLEKYTEQEFVR
jgi:RNA polymerase sigma factor (sigma-70 family)